MSTCRGCSKHAVKIGEPVLHGVFLDQLLDCPTCGWCGVETEIVDPKEYQPKPQQLQMFLFEEGKQP